MDREKHELIAALEADGSAKALEMARWLREWDAPAVDSKVKRLD